MVPGLYIFFNREYFGNIQCAILMKGFQQCLFLNDIVKKFGNMDFISTATFYCCRKDTLCPVFHGVRAD